MNGDIYQYSDMPTPSNTVISSMIKRMPTSINIDEELWSQLKILAIKEKTTATDLLEQAVRDLLAKKSKVKK
ncbi:MAG: hypothetical protein ACRD8Z_16055 [Nitrososphaeraceae archaeon]